MLNPAKIIVDSIRQNITSFNFKEIPTIKADQDYHCAFTGSLIKEGDDMQWFTPSKSFTDWQYLNGHSIKGKFPITPEAALLSSSDFLKYQAKIPAGVYARDEAFILTTDASRMDFLINPPEPPFVAYMATTLGQHVSWRAPITLDKNYIRLGYAKKTLTVNRMVMLKAIDLTKEILSTYNAHIDQENALIKNKKDQKKPLKSKSTFFFLDRSGEDANHGVMIPSLKKFLIEKGRTSDVEFFESLDEGVLWALSVFLKQKEEVPQKIMIEQRLSTPKSEKDQ